MELILHILSSTEHKILVERCNQHLKLRAGKVLTTDAVRKIYLEELENNGYIDKEDSELNKKSNIYWPIVDFKVPAEEKIKKCGIESQSRNLLQYSKILLPKNYMIIKKDWLKLEILGLLEYGIERDQLRLFNESCTDTYCICQFVKEYEKTSSLSLYFSNGENGTSHNEIFGTLQLLEGATN